MSRVDRIDIAEDGTLLVRIVKDDGGYHRTSIEPGISVDDSLSSVNGHLQSMGQQAIQSESLVRAAVALEHTPARINAARARRNRRLDEVRGNSKKPDAA